LIKTAVIGYGLSARIFHLPFILRQPGLELVAISSSQDALRRNHPQLQHYPDGSELIAHSDARLVVITSPNHSHFPLARQALLAGKDVLVEKPFVVTVEEGEELLALAERQQRILAVYHNRRFDGDFMTLQQLVHSGRLGEIRHFESHFDRFRPLPRTRWREQAVRGGGILYDLGPHLIDQALVLFGLPEAVTARCRQLRAGAETTDYFHLQLHYADKEVLLHSSPFCAAPTQRFVLQGTLGSYHKYGLDPQEEALRAGELPGSPGWGLEPASRHGSLHTEQETHGLPTLAGNYQLFYQQLADALQHRRPPPVTPADALRGIRLIELAYRSHAQGRTLEVPR